MSDRLRWTEDLDEDTHLVETHHAWVRFHRAHYRIASVYLPVDFALVGHGAEVGADFAIDATDEIVDPADQGLVAKAADQERPVADFGRAFKLEGWLRPGGVARAADRRRSLRELGHLHGGEV